MALNPFFFQTRNVLVIKIHVLKGKLGNFYGPDDFYAAHDFARL